MRALLTIVSLAAVFMAFVGCRHAPAAQTTTAESVISVEKRPTMFRVISQGKPTTPGIDIFADGRCFVRTFRGEQFEKNLRRADVAQLLEFFDRQGLFSISVESIEHAIDRELQPVRTESLDGSVTVSRRARVIVVDASHTRIVAHTRSNSVDISRYALEEELESYRTVTQLRTIQRCIERVYEVAGKTKQ